MNVVRNECGALSECDGNQNALLEQVLDGAGFFEQSSGGEGTGPTEPFCQQLLEFPQLRLADV